MRSGIWRQIKVRWKRRGYLRRWVRLRVVLLRGEDVDERDFIWWRQVKEDNQETSAMERKIGDLEEQVGRLKEVASGLDMELDSQQGTTIPFHSYQSRANIFDGIGEKNAKYEELLKRDRDMQTFIDAFDDKKAEAEKRNAEMEKSITVTLDKIRV